MEGKNRRPDEAGSFGDFAEMKDISKYTYNAAIFYEDNRFSARLSYNNRGTWVNWYGNTSPGRFAGNKTRTRDRLDFSSSYDVNGNISIYANAANILAKPFRNYTVIEGLRYPQDVRDEGRYFGLLPHHKELARIIRDFHQWTITPSGIEGCRTAEMTLGGVDTDEVSSKTFAAKKVAGLYFVGEVLDVTGWLGGSNFQWVWASGYCAGQYA